MPRRMISPEIWRNEKVGSLPDTGRLLFIGIFSNADDAGRLKASPRYLRALIFPYDNEKTDGQVEELLDRCAALGLIRLYSANGCRLLDIPGWAEHQRIRKDRYIESRLPKYDDGAGEPATICHQDDNPMTPKGEPCDNLVATNGDPSTVEFSSVQSSAVEFSARDPKGSEAAACDQTEQVHSRRKPKQAETGIFLDLVEREIGTRLLQRPKLQGLVRPILLSFPSATPEDLLACFRWLRVNDSYCIGRDSPMVISLLPSKFPEWAAGKLRKAKEVQHGGSRKRRQSVESDGDSSGWGELPADADFSA